MSEPKLCPYRAKYRTPGEYWNETDAMFAPCPQDKCAMWRKEVSPHNEVAEGLPTQYVGYCGLAGKP